MSKDNKLVEEMNVHEKLLKIANMAGVLQKNRAGYNYKYTTEDEIQAKITAGMQKYHVMLSPSIRHDTLKVFPHTYQKQKGKDVFTTVNEVIVSCEVEYTWTNADNPEDFIKCNWAYIGQMEDASQAFGAGATYGNRYYLLKALQLATIEDDPDAYRSKQAKAEEDELKEEKKKLTKAIKEVADKGKELITKGVDREEVIRVVAELNDGNGNPNSIESIELARTVLEELNKLPIPTQQENKGDK